MFGYCPSECLGMVVLPFGPGVRWSKASVLCHCHGEWWHKEVKLRGSVPPALPLTHLIREQPSTFWRTFGRVTAGTSCQLLFSFFFFMKLIRNSA